MLDDKVAKQLKKNRNSRERSRKAIEYYTKMIRENPDSILDIKFPNSYQYRHCRTAACKIFGRKSKEFENFKKTYPVFENAINNREAVNVTDTAEQEAALAGVLKGLPTKRKRGIKGNGAGSRGTAASSAAAASSVAPQAENPKAVPVPKRPKTTHNNR